MKKHLLVLASALLTSLSFAQNCDGSQIVGSFGASPDTTTNLSPAIVGVPYTQTLNFKAPANPGEIDPLYNLATLNNFKVKSVTGLPAGFTYTCSVGNCTYSGGSVGCADLTGTATAEQVGVHNIIITITANLTMIITFDMDRDFPGYKLVITPNNLDIATVSPDQHMIFPNPASKELNVVNAKNFEKLEIYSLNGQMVSSVNVTSEDEKIDISELSNGVYLIHLINGSETKVEKFVKE